MIEYSPSLNETLVCLGIWAFGLLCYTIFLRMSVPILQGRLSKANEGGPDLPAAGETKLTAGEADQRVMAATAEMK